MARSRPKKDAAHHAGDNAPHAHDPSDPIGRDTDIRIQYYAAQDKETIAKRIQELDDEKDLEHLLEANAATLSLLGLVMGVAFSRKWLLLPLVTGAFLLNHAVRGWSQPANALHRMGVRTREEIDREKYALMAARGDFDEARKS